MVRGCTVTTIEAQPFYLQGAFAPVADEVTAFDLPVTGAIPPELAGRFLRNGPNPRAGDPGHWFFGDGMVHGIELRDGRASWYRNRYVRTPSFDEGRTLVGEDGMLDPSVCVANTNVIGHAGRIFALVENSLPTEMDGELGTVGPYDFAGRLDTAMTAHPKECPLTGELHFFGSGFFPPFLTYHVADASGKLVRSEVIDVPAGTMAHDFAITEHWAIFMDLPVVFDWRMLKDGTMPYRWSDEHEARIGLLSRTEPGAAVRWFPVEPCFVFHVLNAAERSETRIEIDVVRYPELWRESPLVIGPATLHRWSVDLAAGSLTEAPLDDRPVEFPRVDDRRTGLPHRYGYAVGTVARPDGIDVDPVLAKYDLATGVTEVHDFGPGQRPGEGVFVPAADEAAEEEGYVVTYVYDAARNGSDLVILDATDFTGPPVATVALPQRVPLGFHGNWLPD